MLARNTERERKGRNIRKENMDRERGGEEGRERNILACKD